MSLLIELFQVLVFQMSSRKVKNDKLEGMQENSLTLAHFVSSRLHTYLSKIKMQSVVFLKNATTF